MASSYSHEVTPSAYEKDSIALTTTIIELISFAYHLPASDFQDLAHIIRRDVTAVFHEAHSLSVIGKRDLQSVRLCVSVGTSSRWIPEHAHAVWLEMGAKPGDLVIGQYNLGLVKLDEKGSWSYLALPKVTTAALLREVGCDYMY